MKKLFAVALGLTALAVTGCVKTNNTSEHSILMLKTSEESGPEGLRLTEYEYDEKGKIVSEKQTLGGRPVYEDADFEYEDKTTTRYRTIHTEGATTNQKRVSTYTYVHINGIAQNIETKFEAFNLGEGGSETDPVERWEWTLSGSGERFFFEWEKDGQIIEKCDKYEYSSLSVEYIRTIYDAENPDGIVEKVTELYSNSERTLIDRIVTQVGDKIVKLQKFDQNERREYKTFIDGDGDGDIKIDITAGGDIISKSDILVEEKIDVKESGDRETVTWTINRFNPEGKFPVSTHYKLTFTPILIKL